MHRRQRRRSLLRCFPRARNLGTKGASNEGTGSILTIVAEPTAQDAAVWAADPYDADKRARGILILANKPFGGEQVYVEMYRLALSDSDPGVRAVAVRALSLHGSASDVPAIVEQFKSEDRHLRWECARALQRMHNPESISALVTHSQERSETESEIRAASCRALGQYADSQSLDALILALDDRDLIVNISAQESLRVLTGEDFGFEVREWVEWKDRTEDWFAGRGEYTYPIFYRTPTWVERIVPWMDPPNEEESTPVGMPVAAEGS